MMRGERAIYWLPWKGRRESTGSTAEERGAIANGDMSISSLPATYYGITKNANRMMSLSYGCGATGDES